MNFSGKRLSGFVTQPPTASTKRHFLQCKTNLPDSICIFQFILILLTPEQKSTATSTSCVSLMFCSESKLWRHTAVATVLYLSHHHQLTSYMRPCHFLAHSQGECWSSPDVVNQPLKIKLRTVSGRWAKCSTTAGLTRCLETHTGSC